MKNLVIVESPSKAKTISKYLGKDYKVMATVGHIIDLPKSKLGIDVDNKYEPEFTTIKGKADIIKKLGTAAKGKKVFLAMDPDREGEAIAWHVAKALKLKKPQRVVFYEITKGAVNEAILAPRKIDDNLVEAQLARRALDRLVGYKVSELVWKKIWYGLSAGRVQSVALRLIVEREKEIEAFVPDEYWDLYAIVQHKKNELKAKFTKKDGKKNIPGSKDDVEKIKKDIGKNDLEVIDVQTTAKSKKPYPPFSTSLLQQAANNLFGFTAKRTMGLAQALYQAGYITYMRTDSFNLAQQAIDAARDKIVEQYGEKYLPEQPNYYKSRSRNAQEAHEAIRPTDFNTSDIQVKADLGPAEAKLYKLIYDRTLACQMKNQQTEVLTVTCEVVGKSKAKYEFRMGGEKVLFDGFRKVWKASSEKDEEQLQQISEVQKGEKLENKKLDAEQHFTKPKPRYTDASLVKALEHYGIGRPSTYATIISTVQSRGYVEKKARFLHPLDVGRVVNEFLMKNFASLVDYEYTAEVEEKLDLISEGKVEYAPFLDKEYKPLVKDIKAADKSVEKNDVVILGKSDEKCDKCGSKMVIRLGRYGKFLSCSKFPECKGMKSIDGGEESIDLKKYKKPEKCPECGAKMLLKNGKYGQFWACERYPECKGIVPMLLHEKCPESGHHLVERRGKWGKNFIGCSGYPECKFIKKVKAEKKSEDEDGDDE
ncbi:MAG: type I DNA topoisomerase [Candidatus Dojkabacteria bacterium]|nr:MAG: type I DNA topoisomerase [Candidatus Dojkabacteria bacterium]